MRKSGKGSDQIDRYSTGFFQSFTPTSYVFFGLLFVGVFAGAWFFFHSDDTTPMKASITAGESHTAEPSLAEQGMGRAASGNQSGKDKVADSSTGQEWRGEISQDDPGQDVVKEQSAAQEQLAPEASPKIIVASAATPPGEIELQPIPKLSKYDPVPAAAPVKDVVVAKSPAKPLPKPIAAAPKLPAGDLWVVQLSVNRNKDLALSWAEKIQKLGGAAYVLEDSTDKGPLYRLRMGFFPTREHAVDDAEKMVKKAGLQSYVLSKATDRDRDFFPPSSKTAP
ncbi:MAG: SPOR domain-containing protein [Desulfovibrionales bacterium]